MPFCVVVGFVCGFLEGETVLIYFRERCFGKVQRDGVFGAWNGSCWLLYYYCLIWAMSEEVVGRRDCLECELGM